MSRPAQWHMAFPLASENQPKKKRKEIVNPLISGGILLAILIAISGFFALARTALTNSQKAKLRHLAEEGVRGATWAERVAEDAIRLLTTVQFGQTLASLTAAAVAAVTFVPWLSHWLEQAALPTLLANGVSLLIIISILAVVLLVLGDKLPETVALRDPERTALSLAWIIHLLSALMAPVVRFITRVGRALAGPTFGNSAGLLFITEEEIKTLVDAGQEEGIIEEDEKAMIYSIFAFGDTTAREVMVPRIDVVAVEIHTQCDKALQVIIEAGHSRIPVYRDNIDNIQGILYAKDFLEWWLEDVTDRPLESLLRPAYFVPESKTLDDLLAELQQRQVHIAIVVDEYGGTAGLVTIEDILEEIVGEIQDEYDSEEATYQIIDQDEYVFDARIDLDDMNEMLNTNLPTEQGDTLGGFVYSQLGKVPAAGEIILFDGYSFEVINVVGRRIKKVRVRRHPPAGDASDDSE
jgi:CBS domain containing-hemolysin-like protein